MIVDHNIFPNLINFFIVFLWLKKLKNDKINKFSVLIVLMLLISLRGRRLTRMCSLRFTHAQHYTFSFLSRYEYVKF